MTWNADGPRRKHGRRGRKLRRAAERFERAASRLEHDIESGMHDALLDDTAMVREMHPPDTEAHVMEPWPEKEDMGGD